MEKNVILEEIGMYEDRPTWRLQDMLLDHYFAGHPLGFRVLGTTDTIKALSAAQMRAYFEHRYCPECITVAAAGRIDFDNLVRDVERIAGGWDRRGAQRAYPLPAVERRELSVRDEKLSRHYLMMMCPGPAADDERRYAARVLADILGDADGSRLYWALVDPGLADEADFSSYPQDRVGAFFAFASCDPDRAAEVERILIDTIEKFPDHLEPDEIERAKNKIATEATLAGESPGGRMRGIGAQWTYLGRYLPLSEELERIMAVSEADLRALFTEMPLERRTVVRLGPGVEG
jgi:predicted Zn-dependent peptidase